MDSKPEELFQKEAPPPPPSPLQVQRGGKGGIMETFPKLEEGQQGQGDAKGLPGPDSAGATAALLAMISLSGDGGVGPGHQECQDKINLILEEKRRLNEADQKRISRREGWREEVKKVVATREFKVKIMSSVSTPPGEYAKKVADWKEKEAMSRMSLEWRQNFRNGRTRFLFHGVAEALQKYTHRNVQDILSNLEVFREYNQSSRDALTCRLVCKSWKSSIDNARSAIFIPFMGYRYDGNRPVLCHDTLPVFHELTGFNFRAKQRYAQKNPMASRKLFVGGVVGILKMNWKDNLPYYQEIERLLRNWGSELWQVFIHFDHGMCPEVMYEQLVKYLKLMPNLRYLAVYDNPRTGDNSPLAMEMMRALGRDEFADLKDRIAKKPLPELPHLTSIHLDPFVPHPIIHALLTTCQSRLEYVSRKVGDEGSQAGTSVFKTLSNSPEPAVFEGTFPSLKELRLLYVNVRGATDVENVFRNLESLSQAPLRELSLMVTGIENGSTIHLAPNFSKRLSFNLPQLERLFLAIYFISLKDLDWLLECVSLKELDLNYVCVPFQSGEQGKKSHSTSSRKSIIQFEEFWERLYQSNIWRMLPELRKVSISITTRGSSGRLRTITKRYSRESYKQLLSSSQWQLMSLLANNQA